MMFEFLLRVQCSKLRNRWKSVGEMSGLYGGYGSTFHPIWLNLSHVKRAVCDFALSCRKITGIRRSQSLARTRCPVEIVYNTFLQWFSDHVASLPSELVLGGPTRHKTWLLVNESQDLACCNALDQLKAIDLGVLDSFFYWKWSSSSQKLTGIDKDDLAVSMRFCFEHICELIGHLSPLSPFLAWNEHMSIIFFNHGERWTFRPTQFFVSLHDYSWSYLSGCTNSLSDPLRGRWRRLFRLTFICLPFRFFSSELMVCDLNFEIHQNDVFLPRLSIVIRRKPLNGVMSK